MSPARIAFDLVTLLCLGGAVVIHEAGYPTLGLMLAIGFGLGVWSGIR